MQEPVYPLVRGVRYSFASIELSLILPAGNREIFIDLQDISYSDALTEELFYGTNQAPIGRSVGQYEPGDASLTMGKQAQTRLVEQIGNGVIGAVLDIVVNYQVPGQDIITDVLQGFRILGFEDSHSSGPGSLVTVCNGKPMAIIRQGFSPLLNHLL